jgi:hypothetical protein
MLKTITSKEADYISRTQVINADDLINVKCRTIRYFRNTNGECLVRKINKLKKRIRIRMLETFLKAQINLNRAISLELTL